MEDNPISILRPLFGCADGGVHHLDRPWPLHHAVRRLAGMSDLPCGLRLELNEHVGEGVAGLEMAVVELHAAGQLAVSSVEPRALVPVFDPAWRRSLLRLRASVADAVYEAARVWVTLSETSEKNWRTARSSFAATVAVPPATPRQLRLGERH